MIHCHLADVYYSFVCVESLIWVGRTSDRMSCRTDLGILSLEVKHIDIIDLYLVLVCFLSNFRDSILSPCGIRL